MRNATWFVALAALAAANQVARLMPAKSEPERDRGRAPRRSPADRSRKPIRVPTPQKQKDKPKSWLPFAKLRKRAAH